MKFPVKCQLQIWNTAFTLYVISMLVTISIAQNNDSINSITVAHKDILTNTGILEKNGNVTEQAHSNLASRPLNKTQDINTERKTNAVNLKDFSVKTKIEITTTNTGDITTVTPDVISTEENEESPTKFNFAIFAAIGFLILTIVVCLKCCSWFRAYTRAGDEKEDSTQYAAILQTGDEEYGHIDLQSDTASTLYFDTISSYQSFLKRNGNDCSITSSSKSQRFVFNRQNSGSPRQFKATIVPKDLDVKYMESKQIRTRAETPDTCSPRSDSAMSDNIRTFSVSSDDTDPSTATLSTSNNDDLNGKKAQRFKVSFITDVSAGPNNIERQRSFNRSSLKRISIERHNRSMSCRSNPSRLSDINDRAFRLKPINKTIHSAGTGSGIDVATQTNKSFTYSRWKSRKRHYSDSGVDEILGPPTINELSSMCSYTDNCGHTSVSPTKSKKMTLETHSEHTVGIALPLTEQVSVKPVTCETPISETESSDDVFATDVSVTSVRDIMNESLRDNNNSCKCVVNQGHAKSECGLGNSGIKKRYMNLPSSSSANDVINDEVYGSSCKGGHMEMENHLNQCKDCLQRQSLISEMKSRCKCKSGTSCNMFLIDETDITCTDICDVYEIEDTVDSAPCSTRSRNNAIPVNVYNVKDELSRLKGGVNADHTLIIEQDMTSSMTSLESSGYAEISSDASTS